MESNSEQGSATLRFTSKKFPRTEIVFLTQILLLYTVAITALVNLTLNTPQRELWIILLSSTLGYILPNPKIKKKQDLSSFANRENTI